MQPGAAHAVAQPNLPAQFAPSQDPTNLPQPPPGYILSAAEKHQAALNHFKHLLQSGYSQESVQTQWQLYYDQLSDEEKRNIWQGPSPASAPVPSPAGVAQPTQSAQNMHLVQDDDNSPTEKVAQPAHKQVDYNTYQDTSSTDYAKASSRFFGIPISVRSYNNLFQRLTGMGDRNARQPVYQEGSSARSSAAVAQPAPSPNQQPPGYAHATNNPVIAQHVPADTRLSNRARNMFTWNSSTALFDKEESRSIWRQNMKSIIFGLTVGVIGLAVWQFTFFNEHYLQPFIQPSSLTTDTQIIITPGETEAEDQNFKIIIPKLNIEAPVVKGIKGFRTANAKEAEAVFEERIQKALQDGTIHYPSTQLPGQSGKNFNSNVVILGHSGSNVTAPGNYKFIFSKLRHMELEDLIVVNYKGTKYIYKIYEKKIVEPDQIEVLQPGDYNNTLTLITCDPPGTIDKRLVLLAKQINPDPANNRDVKVNNTKNKETIVPGESQSLSDVLRR